MASKTNPEFQQFVRSMLNLKKVDFSGKKAKIFDEFVSDAENISTYQEIAAGQDALLKKFMYKTKIFDIVNQHLPIPNATVDKPYLFKFDLAKLGGGDIIYTQIQDLEQYGLSYDNETETISGTPIVSGDFKIHLEFKIKGENDNAPLNSKTLTLVINANPKSLWKNIPSDEGKDEAWKKHHHWKPDYIHDTQALGDKTIVVASKRGRSHANVGSFRDDDYAFRYFKETGWSVVCVADGAGSSKLSREGSRMACNGIVEYFENNFKGEILDEFDQLVKEQWTGEGEEKERQKKLNLFLYNNLGKAAFAVHKQLEEHALKLECTLKDLHSTLIFALFKKYDKGYAVLSFGVGDCPIGLLNKDMTEIKLMNWLDVGEFGGGTRFITMPEIFSSDKFPTRFGFKLIDDFSYLMLMTDGIYDPKFEVEANLEKLDKWKEFIKDLEGNNDEKVKVVFEAGNKEIASQLSAWMDFWSPGNHDDRTLAIVF
jgi:serine/threonine protein phosphatase PrpC